MLTALFYIQATIGALASIIMAFTGSPLPCVIFCAYSIVCIIVGTACLPD